MPHAFEVLRADARDALSSWTAPTASLHATRERMLRVLEAEPACMWRHGSPVHFTASLLVLSPELDEVALTLHRKAKRWFQFGGHFEEADSGVLAAAAREGREESGLAHLTVAEGLVQVDAHPLPPTFGWCHEHLDLRHAAVASSRDLTVSDESEDVRWWPIDALPEDTDVSLFEAVRLAREHVTSVGLPTRPAHR